MKWRSPERKEEKEGAVRTELNRVGSSVRPSKTVTFKQQEKSCPADRRPLSGVSTPRGNYIQDAAGAISPRRSKQKKETCRSPTYRSRETVEKKHGVSGAIYIKQAWSLRRDTEKMVGKEDQWEARSLSEMKKSEIIRHHQMSRWA